MDYHAFKKPKIKNGKKIYKWYYYYTRIRYYHSEIGTPDALHRGIIKRSAQIHGCSFLNDGIQLTVPCRI